MLAGDCAVYSVHPLVRYVKQGGTAPLEVFCVFLDLEGVIVDGLLTALSVDVRHVNRALLRPQRTRGRISTFRPGDLEISSG